MAGPAAIRSAHARLLLLCLLAGCATPLPLYEGPPRPDDEVAIVSASGNATMLQIDGVDIPRLENLFALEPGVHVLLFRVRRTYLDFGSNRGTIEASSVTPQFTTHCFVTLDMEAGHRYEVVSSIWDARRVNDKNPVGGTRRDHVTTVLAGIRDENTGELVPDVRCDHDPRATSDF